MDAELEVKRLLKENGAVLKRDKRHEVWQLPNGQMFTRSKTPSDFRAADNNLTDLKRALGIVEPERGKPGERREKPNKPGREKRTTITPSRTLRDQLTESGVLEEALRVQITDLEAKISNQRLLLETLSGYTERCWGCKLRRFWKRLSRRHTQ